MHRITVLVLVPALLGIPSPVWAHGGAYLGPASADTVPPASGSSSGSIPGAAPLTSTGAPVAPGGARPSAPTSTSGPARSSFGPSAASPDLDKWQLWWGFNSAAYLDLREAIHSSDVLLGSTAAFLGHRPQDQSRDKLIPSPDDIRTRIVPALLTVLARERDADMLTGALIALAKIGERASGGVGLADRITSFLSDDNQEVAETAAISLGILADVASVPRLISILRDDEEARKLLGKGEVPLRSRSFAAYGLGLIGNRTADEELRRRISVELMGGIQEWGLGLPTWDVAVACLSGLGLVPLSYSETELGRRSQVDALLALAERKDVSEVVLAHVPTTLAKLIADAPPSHGLREFVAWKWVEALAEVGRHSRAVEQSMILALGRLGDADVDPLDRRIRSLLQGLSVTSRNPTTRRFAMISLAQVAGRSGRGEEPRAGAAEVRAHLLARLAEESDSERPWAALALGVLGRALGEASLELDREVDRALQAALAAAKAPREVGAFALACGMRRQSHAAPVLLRKLAEVHDDETRGYVALALGMAGAVEALEHIAEVVRNSRYRPELLRQSAISLGLLGDKYLVPELVAMLRESTSLSAQASVAFALGAIGDARSIDPLLEMLGDQETTPRARAFAAVALGIVSDKEARPWNAKLSIGINYRANTATLTDGQGAGILEIL